MENEYSFNCPYCFAEITMLLDTSAGSQKYIEDCEVCCRPIEISYSVENDEIENFYANTLED